MIEFALESQSHNIKKFWNNVFTVYPFYKHNSDVNSAKT